MVEIKKGDSILKVSNSAYIDMFKPMGYEIVIDGAVAQEKTTALSKNNENQKTEVKEEVTTKSTIEEPKELKIESDEQEEALTSVIKTLAKKRNNKKAK